MTEHELTTLAGVYAIDALDDDERSRFEEHLAGCPSCAAEVRSLRGAAAELSHPVASPPPATLRGDLLAAIGRVSPLPPRTGTVSGIGHRRASRRLWPAIAAACALVAVLAAGWGIQQHRQLTENRAGGNPLSSVFDSADVTATSVTLGRAGHATLIYSKARQRLLLIGRDVPAPPAGQTYQLWMLSPTGVATSGGLFQPDPAGNVLVQASGDLAHTAQMGISVEPAGGAAQPTPGAIVAAVPI
ncbi:MAG: anti-sigma factor domain-containing protein [Jatrophihabitantaceae bacterium]